MEDGQARVLYDEYISSSTGCGEFNSSSMMLQTI